MTGLAAAHQAASGGTPLAVWVVLAAAGWLVVSRAWRRMSLALWVRQAKGPADWLERRTAVLEMRRMERQR